MKRKIDEFISEYLRSVRSLDLEKIEQAYLLIQEAAVAGKRVYIIGNGGSAATASHLAADLSKKEIAGKRVEVLSLVDNVSVLTMYGNDYSFEQVFYKQLERLFHSGDLLIIFSVSGNSANLINAAKFVKESSGKTILISSQQGGELRKWSDCSINVETGAKNFAGAESLHLLIAHLFSLLE